MQRCLMAGETVTGVTTMFMDAGLDTGDILLSEEVPIGNDMTMSELHDMLRDIGASLLEKTIEALTNGTLVRKKQDEVKSNYAAMLKKESGRIHWERPAVEIHNLVRALDSWPGAYAMFEDKVYKIWRTRVVSNAVQGKPGEVLGMTKRGFNVATGLGVLEVLDIQAPGKKRMAAADYMRGHAIPEHSFFA